MSTHSSPKIPGFSDLLFRCEKYRCILSQTACVARQARAKSDENGSERFEACAECKQGKAVKRGKFERVELPDTQFEVILTNASSILINESPSAEQPAVILCKRCGTVPAVVRKKDGRPTHGYCPECLGAVRRENFVRRKYGEEGYTEPSEKGEEAMTEEAAVYETDPGAKQEEAIIVDLAAYPEVLPELEKAARTDIRTVEHQALYYIVKGLKGAMINEKHKIDGTPAASA